LENFVLETDNAIHQINFNQREAIRWTDEARFTRSTWRRQVSATFMNWYWRILKVLDTLHFNKDLINVGIWARILNQYIIGPNVMADCHCGILYIDFLERTVLPFLEYACMCIQGHVASAH
jgi:hypothetical protein